MQLIKQIFEAKQIRNPQWAHRRTTDWNALKKENFQFFNCSFRIKAQANQFVFEPKN